MDIVYIVGPGSYTNNLELRMSLRSIAKYGKNVGRVIVAGTPPDWLSDEVVKCPFTQTAARKNLRIFETILHVIDTMEFTDGEFLVSMDDHMYTREVDFDNYPYYNKITMPALCGCGTNLPSFADKYNGNELYGNILKRTHSWLEAGGYPTLNMTLHRNMHMSVDTARKHRNELDEFVRNTDDMEGMCALIDIHLKEHPEIKPIEAYDNKVFNSASLSKIMEHECFSTSTTALMNREILQTVSALYSEPSKYEK